MYRHRAYQQVGYGHFNEFLKANDELNAIARKKGWPERQRCGHRSSERGTMWSSNTDYADLATFERLNRAFQADAEAMKIYRGTAGIVVQGSVRDEIFEQVTRPLA